MNLEVSIQPEGKTINNRTDAIIEKHTTLTDIGSGLDEATSYFRWIERRMIDTMSDGWEGIRENF